MIRTWNRRLRWHLLCLLCVATSLLGVPPQNPEAQKNSCEPPGRFVDFGLHICCVGPVSRDSTVILLQGLGDNSFDWGLVQPEVARFTHVCSYDRAGAGWSEPGPAPRGPLTVAKELHSLLKNARESGPYVLVGHSWGGLIARVYSSQYPTEVAGMVLIEHTHEDMYFEINRPIVVPRLVTESDWEKMKPKGSRPAVTQVKGGFSSNPSVFAKLSHQLLPQLRSAPFKSYGHGGALFCDRTVGTALDAHLCDDRKESDTSGGKTVQIEKATTPLVATKGCSGHLSRNL